MLLTIGTIAFMHGGLCLTGPRGTVNLFLNSKNFFIYSIYLAALIFNIFHTVGRYAKTFANTEESHMVRIHVCENPAIASGQKGPENTICVLFETSINRLCDY